MNDLRNAFPGQERDEAVFVFARPYFLAFLPTAFVFLLVFAFGLGFQYLLGIGAFPQIDTLTSLYGIALLGIFQVIVLNIFLATILDFYFDIVIVTDRRVVDINQDMLFFRQYSQLSLENVEDVSSTINGPFQTLFGYGLVMIQTAGPRENFMMDSVRHPKEITSIVLDLADQAKADRPESQRMPDGAAVAVINGRVLTTATELSQIGAILPDDLRRTSRNAAG